MKTRPIRRAVLSGLLFAAWTGISSSHHSYAVFDMTQSKTVQGSVAKVEWINPHVFVWIYVPKPGAPKEYELYAFENGPINMMVRFGWSKDALKAGDKLAVQYFPLRDGRKGGYFVRGLRADGSELRGDPHAPGVTKALESKSPLTAPAP
jgi:hypothetical protein